MNKRFAMVSCVCVFLLTVCGIFSSTAWALQSLSKITDNVYSYIDAKKSSPSSSYGANAGIIIGTKSVLVVDTLISAKQARHFIKDIRAVTDKPVKFAVNTHNHLDHTFGNSEFTRRKATIVAHKNCLANMKKTSAATLKNAKTFGLSRNDMKGTRISYPTVTFNDRMIVDLGGQRVELIYTGPSHTDDSVLVYVRDKRLLFAGDVLFTAYHPFVGDGDINEWVKTLDQILEMEVETIIPGHGPVSTKKDVLEMKNYLITLDSKARELSKASKDPDYVAAELLKALPARPEGSGLMKWNVMRYLKQQM